jgi:hypothetical protein
MIFFTIFYDFYEFRGERKRKKKRNATVAHLDRSVGIPTKNVPHETVVGGTALPRSAVGTARYSNQPYIEFPYE